MLVFSRFVLAIFINFPDEIITAQTSPKRPRPV